MSRRTYTFTGYESTLTSPITAGSTIIALASTTGLTAPCYLAIEADSLSKRELIKVGSISAPSLENVTRGLAGSVAGAQGHDSGVKVRAVIPHQLIDDVFFDIIDLETFENTHGGGTDVADHPEVTGSVRGFMSSADKTKLDALPAWAVVGEIADVALAAAAGVLDKSARGDHAHPLLLADAVSPTLITGGLVNFIDAGTPAIAASGTWTLPSGWTTALLMVFARTGIRNTTSGGYTMELFIGPGSDSVSNWTPDDETWATMYYQVVSANALVKLEGKSSAGSMNNTRLVGVGLRMS